MLSVLIAMLLSTAMASVGLAVSSFFTLRGKKNTKIERRKPNCLSVAES